MSNDIIALEKPVVETLMAIDSSAAIPASSGFDSKTYSCKIHPGMLSVAISVPLFTIIYQRKDVQLVSVSIGEIDGSNRMEAGINRTPINFKR